MSQILPSGTLAPDFALHVTPDQTVSLSEFRGRPVILAFYPACNRTVSVTNTSESVAKDGPKWQAPGCYEYR